MRNRSCAACRKCGDKGDFIRIVRTPDGRVETDFSQKKDGRGAYLCRNAGCVDTAEKRRSLNRVLRCGVDAAIYEKLREAIINGEAG